MCVGYDPAKEREGNEKPRLTSRMAGDFYFVLEWELCNEIHTLVHAFLERVDIIQSQTY